LACGGNNPKNAREIDHLGYGFTPQGAQEGMAHSHRAPEIDGEYPLHIFNGELGKASHESHAGIIDENVDAR
jgi:hypothetical protein